VTLEELYAGLATAAPAARDCGSCHRCCVGPPLYMTCTRLEYDHALTALTEAAQRLVTFKELRRDAPDERLAFRHWTCPFYSAERGCTVYGKRPLACRVFGPYSREPIPFPCVYEDASVHYESPGELPLWDAYSGLTAHSPRGYVFPTQLQFERPGVELLLGVPNDEGPLSRLRI